MTWYSLLARVDFSEFDDLVESIVQKEEQNKLIDLTVVLKHYLDPCRRAVQQKVPATEPRLCYIVAYLVKEKEQSRDTYQHFISIHH